MRSSSAAHLGFSRFLSTMKIFVEVISNNDYRRLALFFRLPSLGDFALFFGLKMKSLVCTPCSLNGSLLYRSLFLQDHVKALQRGAKNIKHIEHNNADPKISRPFTLLDQLRRYP